MPYSLDNHLVIGVSSRVLFDLTREDALYREEGLEAYERYQLEHETEILQPGTGFPLIKAILDLNRRALGDHRAEVIIMSQNSAETSLRLFNSIEHYGLDIIRAVLTGGASLAPYLNALKIDLFLSLDEEDVQAAVNSGVAAAIVYQKPENRFEELDQIRIAFDGDAVLFSDDSERIYKEQGLEAFAENERANILTPLSEGPFAKFLKSLSHFQKQCKDDTICPIRTALVTARGGPAHTRVILTLRSWGVNIDEAFFLGGLPKADILKAFKPHMFFDDQSVHCDPASLVVATARVPYVVRDEIAE